MISATRRRFSLFIRRLWVRASLFSVVGVLAALAAVPVANLIPDAMADGIGSEATGSILGIIASSMLAVTTFSLSTVVSAYGAATSNVTPRATQLLIEDKTAQNTLSVFVGTFIYSFVTLILLSTNAYGERGRVALFIVTLAVVAIMVATLLRWIDYLLRFGRVGETTENVEEIARKVLSERWREPYLGANRLRPDDISRVHSIHADEVGYVQHVDMGRLNELAAELQVEVTILASPGTFVHQARAVAAATRELQGDEAERIRSTFTVANSRSFDQDPRFGMIVLAEVGSRALSQAINDAGTAIDVIGRGVRILASWREQMPQQVIYSRLHVPELTLEELMEDFFGPLARDGARILEVQVRLQKALGYLYTLGDERMRLAALEQSNRALDRADLAGFANVDRMTIEAAAEWSRTGVQKEEILYQQTSHGTG